MNIRKVILAGAAAVALAISGLPAHSQLYPQNQYGWTGQRVGGTTFYNGTGGNQGWTGNSQNIGGSTFSNFLGPNGQRRSCNTQYIGGTAFTNCN